MAIAVRGLNVRRQYEDPIGVAFSDGLGNIKLLNRNAPFLSIYAQKSCIYIIFVLYLMECVRYAFNTLTVSDGMFLICI